MKSKTLAIIIGIVGLIGMFFFPSPQENFIWYVGFVAVVMALIIFVLKFGKGKK